MMRQLIHMAVVVVGRKIPGTVAPDALAYATLVAKALVESANLHSDHRPSDKS